MTRSRWHEAGFLVIISARTTMCTQRTLRETGVTWEPEMRPGAAGWRPLGCSCVTGARPPGKLSGSSPKPLV
jgi:hypothetical protein